LAQNLEWACDIEQEQTWRDYDEHRDAADVISIRRIVGRAGNRFIVTIKVSGSSS